MQQILSVPLMTAWTCLIALLDQGQCSASSGIELFTKLFSNSPLQEVLSKELYRQYTYLELINALDICCTIHSRDSIEIIRLSQSTRGTFQSHKGFHAHTMCSYKNSPTVLKFSFPKHLIQLFLNIQCIKALACSRAFIHCIFVPTEGFCVC